MDRKLPNKLKKNDYEPVTSATYFNISPPALRKNWIYENGSLIIPSVPNSHPEINLPSPFCILEISNLERSAFNKYFHDTTSEAFYIVIRNTMLNLYHQNPHQYLSIGDCTKYINSELRIIADIHQLLEQYNLINFKV